MAHMPVALQCPYKPLFECCVCCVVESPVLVLPNCFPAELVPPGPRPLKRHSVWSLIVCCRLSLPLMLCCVLVGAVYIELQDITLQTHQSSMVARVMSQRAVRCSVSPPIALADTANNLQD